MSLGGKWGKGQAQQQNQGWGQGWQGKGQAPPAFSAGLPQAPGQISAALPQPARTGGISAGTPTGSVLRGNKGGGQAIGGLLGGGQQQIGAPVAPPGGIGMLSAAGQPIQQGTPVGGKR